MSFWLQLSVVATFLAPQEPAARDWAETLRADATAVHEAIASSHPGMINPDDPGFSRLNDAQYALALERARGADSFADYFYAVQHYLAAFDDGHLGFGVFGSTPDNVARWPGFIARDDGRGGLVVSAAEPWAGVEVGARLVECDGRTAFQLGNDRMGARFGRWELAASRFWYSGMVMLDTGDPYVRPVRQCLFDMPEGRRPVVLDWRDGGPRFYSRHQVVPEVRSRAVGMRRGGDGAYWLTLPTFNGDPESEHGKALRALVEQIHADAAAVRGAPMIVLDLRGNGGGSSTWSREIAQILWGEGAMERAPEPPMTVVWRASPGNLDALREALAQRDASGGLSPDARNWYRNTITGLEAALARSQDRWVIEPSGRVRGDGETAPAVEPVADTGPTGKIVVLTDEVCMSACLDAVDLWTRLGAVTAGRETGADTVYMESRSITLPSGLGVMAMPMKYYRGRARGSNQPVTPTYPFNGDMNDDAAVEAWVATLPR